MLKPLAIIAIVVGGYFYTRQSETPASTGTGRLSDAGLLEETVARKQLVLVDFWAPWCAPCRAIAPTISALALERKDIGVAKVNVDERKDAWKNFNIKGIPCLILFKDGKEVDRIMGGVPKAAIEQMIAKHQ